MGLFSCSDDNETAAQLLPPAILKVSVWDENSGEWKIPEAEMILSAKDRMHKRLSEAFVFEG